MTNDQRPAADDQRASFVRRPSSSIVVAFVEQESQLGGVEMSTLALACNLDPGRYRPLVIAPENGPLTERCQAAGIPVHLSPRPRFRSASWRWRGRTFADPLAVLVNPARLWQASRPLAHLLAECRADLVVTKGLLAHFYGGWAARTLGIPCIWHVQDEIPERRAGGLYLATLRRAARRWAAAVVGDAATIAAQFHDHASVHVVYNGVDLDEFSPHTRPASLRTDLGIPDDALLVGNLARLTPWKGQHLLIEAVQRLVLDEPRLHLALIGSPLFDDDDYERRLRRLAADGPAAGRIHFAGYRTDAAACLAALDIYVHPSLRKDTAPLALLSALATGLPTVISAVPGMLEVVEPDQSAPKTAPRIHTDRHGLGPGFHPPRRKLEPLGPALVFPPGGGEALAEHLRRLARDSDLRLHLSAEARNLAVQRFGVQGHVRAMQAVFDQVLNGPNTLGRK